MNKTKLTAMILALGLAVLQLPAAWAEAGEGEALPHPEVLRIEADELKQLIENDADIVIVDVRDSLSYEFGHIPGAVNIFYDPTGDPMGREMMLVALPMNKMIVLYCP